MLKYVIVLLVSVLFVPSCLMRSTKGISNPSSTSERLTIDGRNDQTDTVFLSTLITSGVMDAARQIGLDFNKYLIPLARQIDHPYNRYRWSVDYHEGGGVMISAFPPEEETGWTPWERWYKDNMGMTRKESWVMYPLKDPTSEGVAHWYKLNEEDLYPRYMNKPVTLEDQLHLARVDVASKVLGFDAEEILIKPLSAAARAYYLKCRWVVIPHILAADGPVIYILPPANHTDEWPWESWYSDGKARLIHHVHYTRKNKLTTGSWKEYPGAPQRPPEIFGVVWYWYDDLLLRPSMADIK